MEVFDSRTAMGQDYSMDLRARVVADVEEGRSRREAARRLRVSASSAVRWAKLHELTGSLAPKPRGGRSRSPLAPLTDWLLALITAEPDLTLDAIAKQVFETHGVKTSTSSVDRFYARHKISFKKKPARQRTRTA
jgi:transposase